MSDLQHKLSSLVPLAVFGLLCNIANAATVEVTVVDSDQRPIADVAVFVQLENNDPLRQAAPDGATATMDQVNRRFTPGLLVVQTGTSVEFPNSDSVAHHVYSFSHPNQFKLPLYKGNAHAPVTFLENGVVSLGCNVHDNMLGYILVVDTPYFSKTNAQGRATIDVSETAVTSVGAWSPRFRDSFESLARPLEPQVGEDWVVRIQVENPLRPPHDQITDALSWSDY